MSTRKKLLVVGFVLIILGAGVLGVTFALSPQVEGINIYALLAFVLAPLLIAAVLVSVGLSSGLMAFIIPEKFCIECGKPIDLDSRFCKYCGHKYEELEPSGL